MMFSNRVAKALGIAVGVSFVVGVSQPVQAAIVGVSGNAVLGDATGADLSNGGVFENSGIVTGFSELQGVTTTAPLNVDFLISESDIGQQFGGVIDNSVDNPLTLGSGTFGSALLHFDAVEAGSVTNATFTFAGDIVAVIANATFLEQSDSVFGVASVFSGSGARRAEQNDLFTILDSNTIQVDAFTVGAPFVDNLRVITTASAPNAAVPEPLTVVGSVVALGFGAAARRRQKAS